jgi:hypothetical protein
MRRWADAKISMAEYEVRFEFFGERGPVGGVREASTVAEREKWSVGPGGRLGRMRREMRPSEDGVKAGVRLPCAQVFQFDDMMIVMTRVVLRYLLLCSGEGGSFSSRSSIDSAPGMPRRRRSVLEGRSRGRNIDSWTKLIVLPMIVLAWRWRKRGREMSRWVTHQKVTLV